VVAFQVLKIYEERESMTMSILFSTDMNWNAIRTNSAGGEYGHIGQTE